jgi:hypothetical protein
MHHNALVLTAELHRKHGTALGHFMSGPTGQHLFVLACVALIAIMIISCLGRVLGSKSS